MKGHSPQTKTPIFWKVTQMNEGFLIDKGVYAAVPFGGQLMILHDGQQLKLCRTESSARNYIDSLRKGKSVAELPIE